MFPSKACRHTISLSIREVQITTTLNYCLTPVRVAVIKEMEIARLGENVERGNPSGTVGGIGGQCSHCEKQYRDSLKKKKKKKHKPRIQLPCDPAIPLLDIYLENMKTLIQKDTHP